MRIGIIGGSGLYDMEGLRNVEKRKVATPLGEASDEYVCGVLSGVDVCFLPRHGVGHRLLPSEIDHRSNIMGFKMLGVDRIVSVSAVGSLSEQLHPRDIVLPDQYFDRTKKSLEHTFFGNGVVAHVGFGEPACPSLREQAAASITDVLERQDDECKAALHVGGTYVNMEGPAFSTKAESNVYRSMGFDIIGMTSLPEAKLCREAEICYQAVAMVTDYDCWHESEEDVSVEMLIGHLNANVKLAKEVLADLIPRVVGEVSCACGESLKTALFCDPALIPEETKTALRPIIGKYVD